MHMGFSSRIWEWPDRPPWPIGSCTDCGCLVLLLRFGDGRTSMIDPPFVDRRWMRSVLSPASVAVQGFAGDGACVEYHVCPPPSERRLPQAPQRAAAYRASRGGSEQ